MSGARPLALVAALLVSFCLSGAAAAPTMKDRAEAKSLWTKGKRLTQQKKHDEAADAYRAAPRQPPR